MPQKLINTKFFLSRPLFLMLLWCFCINFGHLWLTNYESPYLSMIWFMQNDTARTADFVGFVEEILPAKWTQFFNGVWWKLSACE